MSAGPGTARVAPQLLFVVNVHGSLLRTAFRLRWQRSRAAMTSILRVSIRAVAANSNGLG